MLQTTVNATLGFGVPGEFFNDGPHRAKPYNLNSADAAYNLFARAFTVVSEGVAKAGGTGVFAGLMVSPKEAALNGTALGGTLDASLTLKNGEIASLATMGEIIIQVPAAANIGDRVLYDTTTGELSTVGASFNGTGVIATTTLTVSGAVAGSAPLGVGSVVTGPNVAPNTIITALGTGTGGNGTYTVNNSQTAASGNITAAPIAPAGKAFVPSAVISQYTPTAAGLAVAKLTN